MKIARVRTKEYGETYGILSNDSNKIITKNEIQEQTGIPLPLNIKEFLFNNWLNEVIKNNRRLNFIKNINDTELLAPLSNPSKIICLAFNYYDHAKDAGLTPNNEPVIFLKPRTALNNPYDDILCPGNVQRLDYEAEIAVIIGKITKKVTEDEAINSIFGYMIFHDVSARDIQFQDKQFTRGKSIDTFAPCGPWITTKDEINDPQNLKIITKVNGEVRQNSTSSKMVIPIKKIISSLSQLITIEPGDIISTGTPAGVAMSMNNPKYLKDGDLVEISIEKLGTIRNKVIFIDKVRL
ncbi:MAG TPA: fumarylacetoacetate hydrolase family protein [Nitrososphaeraceae archaeon]|jgi:2-keto-4-pentenoate hydratase/2-oxohepta-3-ene-1,7-dioic acid hydratase in catechol pathway|nr:fumarylacetoacetate hydrolase family protein [Nitrososphaeraceae archaeon]